MFFMNVGLSSEAHVQHVSDLTTLLVNADHEKQLRHHCTVTNIKDALYIVADMRKIIAVTHVQYTAAATNAHLIACQQAFGDVFGWLHADQDVLPHLPNVLTSVEAKTRAPPSLGDAHDPETLVQCVRLRQRGTSRSLSHGNDRVDALQRQREYEHAVGATGQTSTCRLKARCRLRLMELPSGTMKMHI